jgi:hypothetical protein
MLRLAMIASQYAWGVLQPANRQLMPTIAIAVSIFFNIPFVRFTHKGMKT